MFIKSSDNEEDNELPIRVSHSGERVSAYYTFRRLKRRNRIVDGYTKSRIPGRQSERQNPSKERDKLVCIGLPS